MKNTILNLIWSQVLIMRNCSNLELTLEAKTWLSNTGSILWLLLKYVIVSQGNANCLQIHPLFAYLELNYTYPEIQALSLVKKTITKINFWYEPFRQGKTINVWAYISKDFIANFNFIAPISAKMLYQYSVYSDKFGTT